MLTNRKQRPSRQRQLRLRAELLAPAPWAVITAALARAARANAVTPYFTDPKLVPLGRGDRLVVDASEANVRAGLTNPFAIDTLRKRGVKCYSVAGLHAKLYIADDIVFIGSANASANSRNELLEACAKISDRALATASSKWIDSLALEPLLPSRLKALQQIYRPPKRASGPRPKPATAWVVAVTHEDDTEALRAYQTDVAKRTERAVDDVLAITYSGNVPRVFRDGRAGDEVFVIDGTDGHRVYGPTRLIENPEYSRNNPARLAVEEVDHSITFRAFEKAAQRGDTIVTKRSAKRLKPGAAQAARSALERRGIRRQD